MDGVALNEAKWFFDPYQKRIKEFKVSLKKYKYGRKKGDDGLHEMHLENLALSKDYAKSLEESYFINKDSFESTLKRVEHFYPIRSISWE